MGILAAVTFAAGIGLHPATAPANTTNTVPYTESFEGYAAGTSVVGAGGWYAAETTAAVVIEEAYTYTGALPLPDPHSKVLSVSEPITNLVTGTPNGTDYFDAMVNPRAWEEDTPPTVPDGAQLAAYVNTNHHLVLWHRHYTIPQSPDQTNQWTELTDTYIGTGTWFRLTFELNYANLDFPAGGLTFFRCYVDGLAVTNAEGRTQPFTPSLPGGAWFAMADISRKYVSGFSVTGTGKFDDMQIVSTNPITATIYRIQASVDNASRAVIIPSGVVPVLASNNVTFTMYATSGNSITNVLVDGAPIGPTNSYTFTTVTADHTIRVLSASAQSEWTENGTWIPWLESFGLTADDDNLDTDGDGHKAWEEYVMGTIPINPTSVCHVVNITFATGSNSVSWYATTNSGVTKAFELYRATDTVNDEFDWQRVGLNIPRAGNGTNVWWDQTAPSAGPVYYRPMVPRD